MYRVTEVSKMLPLQNLDEEWENGRMFWDSCTCAWVCLGRKAADWITHSKGRSLARKWTDVMMMSWENQRIPHKGIKERNELLDWPEQLKTMASEDVLSSFSCALWCTLWCVKWVMLEMVDWWKHTGFYSAHFHMWRSTASVYSMMRRTPSQGTIVDYGRIFLYFPRLDGTGRMMDALSYVTSLWWKQSAGSG